MRKIIIIEDDEVIREELQSFLERYGYEVKAPLDMDNIINYIESENAELILLDINLPMYDGYYICREIRKTSEVPIIIVTSRDSEVDELMSMNLGADDFITKPYNTEILLARITNSLKRTYGNIKNSNILSYRDFNLNLSNATIIYKDNSLELTKNEVKILSFLINNKGNIVKRDSLMEYLWKADFFVDDSTLNVNINRLRKKLEEIGIENPIETRRGMGYIMP
ncbi:response regulator transcription factor [Clostridium beijerinckii]|jgi:Response regulators consisting of a CheY-like receiver domain and a winged-helix DNA-binding domain|uniref:Stage 0 sporulation protein A homolog n=2 Tax=Clostridium beijerinckii TaxID=1520 RepID=A0AAE2UYB5_CLOBE|nr:response regulator transcription factor [Clostridium beijerinckii]ABR35964.1 two component transcriptional regulator, winged helix family [Clostridium beijerinckii NCIMB 8052]AIU03731.1 two component transcriptional regulator [Clostridium beijerinckii ATCC 35702]MBF7809395.1 response regulator transcription factor [Clostridium beijerinckii]NRT22990.1 DNA-binding response OmpR family regulator [Clostridium beijerinckii]NRT69850.1 DNA-binding response OmpR family regulator [Clostridium beijer